MIFADFSPECGFARRFRKSQALQQSTGRNETISARVKDWIMQGLLLTDKGTTRSGLNSRQAKWQIAVDLSLAKILYMHHSN
ncbi:hypothetical protein LNP74_25170 [Klebsiella pneumoniae subsp. pneumoniae]|nr:hypothetical protein [Klebsiella pneumoniae subsp. pneumoniae]